MQNRYLRQNEIIKPSHQTNPIAIAGCGAIGRQLAIQLLTMGFSNISLYDFDHVEDLNLASQGWTESDVGKPKVTALSDTAALINSSLSVQPFIQQYAASPDHSAIFLCVDTMQARSEIYESTKHSATFICDARMAAELIRIVTAKSHDINITPTLSSPKHWKPYYPTTLCTDAEAYQPRCTAQTTLYCAAMAASLLISQYTKHLRNFITSPADYYFSLLGNSITPGNPTK